MIRKPFWLAFYRTIDTKEMTPNAIGAYRIFQFSPNAISFQLISLECSAVSSVSAEKRR